MLLAPALHRQMARLALLAMALLLVVPTVGRLVERGPGTDDVLAAVCTVTGLKYIAPDQLGRTGVASHGALPDPTGAGGKPSPSPHPGADCDYCPLLAATALLAVLCALAPWLFAPNAPAFAPATSRRFAFLHPCGLGSRGPPIAL